MKIKAIDSLKDLKYQAIVIKSTEMALWKEKIPLLKKIKDQHLPDQNSWNPIECLESGLCIVLENFSSERHDYHKKIQAILEFLENKKISKTLWIYHGMSEKATSFVIHIRNALFRYEDFLSDPKKRHLKEIMIFGHDRLLARYIQIGEYISNAIHITRTLAETPPNICTPSFLAKEAIELGKINSNLEVSVLGLKEIKALKMNSFLSVSKGSAQEPKFISIRYAGTKKGVDPIIFIGKGITYDTGGHSLKPASSMMGMKFDMSGAASVLGLMQFVAEAKLSHPIIGLIPTCENIPGGDANKPDDIVISMSGQSIEILNTDAEGRLILCDAMTYAERFNPKFVIDIATLTGSCVATFGTVASGLMGNDKELMDLLLDASERSSDKVWPLPLWDEYDEELRSPVADMANIGGQYSGAITAGCFLKRFAKNFRWAHLDVAGTACIFQGHKRGSTGRPLPLLTDFLLALDREAE